jgi:hypothetical protein
VAAILIFNFRFLLKNSYFNRELTKQKRVPSMPNHKLCKNIYIAKICSVVQQITISQSDITELIYDYYYYYYYYYAIWMTLVTGFFFLVLFLNQQ